MPFYAELKRQRNKEKGKRTLKGLGRLRKALAKHFKDHGSSTDRSRSVRIATWNLREFGGTKHGGRDYEPLYYIAETISQFDIVALQEVRENLRELRKLMRILGPDWDYIATDVTDGSAGNGERMVFLFNQRKAHFRNVAGELTLRTEDKILASFGERLRISKEARLHLPVGHDLSGEYKAKTKKLNSGTIKLDCDLELPLPEGTMLEVPEGSALTLTKGSVIERPRNGVAKVAIPTPVIDGKSYRLRLPGGSLDDSFKQFARTPYIVAFQAGWLKINLCTVHIYFGSNEVDSLLEQRKGEIRALSNSLGKRAEGDMEADPEHRTFFAALGDFNIISAEHETMKALENNGFKVPEEIRRIPGSNVKKDKAYDQIAFWKPDADRGYAKMDILSAGVFDFFSHVYKKSEESIYKPQMGSTRATYDQWRTYKMSDHLPMWVELRSDFSDEYLEDCLDN